MMQNITPCAAFTAKRLRQLLPQRHQDTKTLRTERKLDSEILCDLSVFAVKVAHGINIELN